MTYVFRAWILAIALLLSPSLYAQTLWTKAEYGMTVDQVKAAFPQAASPAKPSRLGNGALGLLTMPRIPIAGSDFQAHFYFLSGKLVQVTLSLENPGKFSSVLITFGSIEEILRAKYGHELQREVSRGVVERAAASWIFGPTNISVLAMGVDGSDAILNINYQVRLSQEAEKL